MSRTDSSEKEDSYIVFSSNSEEYPVKCIAADSSSLILLQKTNLLEYLIAYSRLVIADTVYIELTENKKPGAEKFSVLLKNCVVKQLHELQDCRMGNGERQTIGLYKDRKADYVLVDDKKAALYCYANKIPFINSLLLPKLLYYRGVLSKSESRKKMEELFRCGYYSLTIWKKAIDISRVDMHKFLLDNKDLQ